ncbi:MAG: polymer-forming cytoskeletal protein [Acidobacteriota bacterium]
MNDSVAGLDGHLAEGTRISGTLKFDQSVRIDGEFEGKVESAGRLILGPSAKVDAEVAVGELEVRGHLSGQVHASRRMLIRDGGVVEANIKAGRLSIETGAIFRGHCEMPEQERLPASGARAEETTAPRETTITR